MSDYKNLTKQEASQRIAEITKTIGTLVNELENIADAHDMNVELSFSGFGGNYIPLKEHWDSSDSWDSSDEESEENSGPTARGWDISDWMPSSAFC